ncbi:MAG: hypothetical protein KC652_05175 [Cyanobacteria bacterium HKST-UBA01]|nr:hypothetical protein [Cyanobacteria bacterium HKST-UBA01]
MKKEHLELKVKNAIAYYELEMTIDSEPGEIFKTPISIGAPFQEEGQWYCEELVGGFSGKTVPGGSSLEALTGALACARIDIEMLDLLGYRFQVPGKPELDNNESVLKHVFGLYSSMPSKNYP